MSRTATMAAGFFLIFTGLQLHLVESFTMTPRVSHFVNDNFSQRRPAAALNNAVAGDNFSNPRQDYNSPYYQASFGQPSGNQLASAPVASISSPAQATIVPPRWICWPVLFLGAFLLLQGATKSRD